MRDKPSSVPSMKLLQQAMTFWRRIIYRPGGTLSRFIAKDVRREVLVVSTDELGDGIITVQIRTTNILYRSADLVAAEQFGDAVRIPISTLWKWTGKPWGGLADGTSIVAHLNPSLPELPKDG